MLRADSLIRPFAPAWKMSIADIKQLGFNGLMTAILGLMLQDGCKLFISCRWFAGFFLFLVPVISPRIISGRKSSSHSICNVGLLDPDMTLFRCCSHVSLTLFKIHSHHEEGRGRISKGYSQRSLRDSFDASTIHGRRILSFSLAN